MIFRESDLKAIVDFGFYTFSKVFDFTFGNDLFSKEEPFKILNRILSRPGLKQFCGNVLRSRGFLVAPHSECKAFKQNGSRILPHGGRDFSYGFVHGKYVVTVDLSSFNTIAGGLVNKVRTTKLLARWRG